jgi:hypothetical protein
LTISHDARVEANRESASTDFCHIMFADVEEGILTDAARRSYVFALHQYRLVNFLLPINGCNWARVIEEALKPATSGTEVL